MNPLYQARKFNLSGLNGISDQTLEMHFKLYEGYVKETNVLQEKIAAILKDGKVDQEEMPAYSELKRRLGFEYNGMVLHEYYFGNLKKEAAGIPSEALPLSRLRKRALLATKFGKQTSWASAKCEALAGRSVITIQPPPVYPIIGSPCMRSAMLQAIPRC